MPFPFAASGREAWQPWKPHIEGGKATDGSHLSQSSPGGESPIRSKGTGIFGKNSFLVLEDTTFFKITPYFLNLTHLFSALLSFFKMVIFQNMLYSFMFWKIWQKARSNNESNYGPVLPESSFSGYRRLSLLGFRRAG